MKVMNRIILGLGWAGYVVRDDTRIDQGSCHVAHHDVEWNSQRQRQSLDPRIFDSVRILGMMTTPLNIIYVALVRHEFANNFDMEEIIQHDVCSHWQAEIWMAIYDFV